MKPFTRRRVQVERLVARRGRRCSRRVEGVVNRQQRMSGLLLWMFRITAATAIAVPSRTVLAQVATIGNGVTATGLVANSGGAAIDVLGTANHTTLGNGGTQWIEAGGTASGTVVNGGGLEVVSSGGMASASLVNSAGTQSVFAGGTALSTTVNSNGLLTVSSGGVANSATVSSGGIETVSSGGLASATTLDSSGKLMISAGGSATGIVQSSGAAIVADTNAEQVSGINDNGLFLISGGIANNVLLENGGQLSVSSGGTASGTTVGNGGAQVILSGGVANDTRVSNGFDIVSSGGVASRTTVSGGGLETVLAGGTANDTTVVSQGSQTVLGTTSGTTVDAGGTVTVGAGGITSGTLVSSGGSEAVLSGGSTLNTNVASGGQQQVLGGQANETAVSASGVQIVASGGKTSGTLVFAGGTETILTGGSASATQLSAGGISIVSSGGIANGTIVSSGGTEHVSGGTAVGTSIRSGGQQIVAGGGTTNGALVSSGGAQIVDAGGVTTGTMVASGGIQDVLSGGTANQSVISSGGVQTISSGASASGTQVMSGGSQNLFGSVTDPVVSSGGILTIGQGTAAGNIVGDTVDDGQLTFNRPDTLTYAGSITGTGRIEQQGTGTLVLNGDSHLFGGVTEVAAGELAVGDSDNPGAQLGGDVIVDALGTLRGHGTIGGSLANTGKVMPGGSIGTLSVGGNYTQASGASLSIEVSPTSGSQLKVGGTAALNGGLQILYDPGTYQPKRYAILTAGGGVNGQFTNVSSTLVAGAQLGSLQQGVEYSANEVDLVLSGLAQQPPGGGQSPSGPVVIAPSGTSIFTALGTTLALSAQMTNAEMLERVPFGGNGTPAGDSAWAIATGSQAKVHGSDGAPGFEARNYGFIAGLDQHVGSYMVGFSGSYSHSDISEDGSGDSGTTDTLRAAFYGGRAFGPVDVSATVGTGVDFLSQKRPFGALGTAQGDHVGQEANAAAQAALPLTLAGVTVTPRLGMRFSYLHANGFGEDGANGQDLSIGTDNVRSLQPYAQIAFDKVFGNELRPVNIEVRVGYAHELLDTGRTVTVGTQDSTLFAAPGASLPQNQVTTGVSVGMRPTKALTVSLGYDALLAPGHASAQAANLKVDYEF